MGHAADTAVPYHGTLKGYMTGFTMSLLLTAIPFGLVMAGTLPRSAILFGILLAAVVQIVVHLHYFLHLDTSSSERWNVMALLFTVLIMVILLAGSIWIMYNLRVRMMDTSPPAAMATSSMAMPMSMPEKSQP
jgi:cytochrome o ubiquinol oxidase operon protein cyoD